MKKETYRRSIILSQSTYLNLRKEKDGEQLCWLYQFYLDNANNQKTNQPYITVPYIVKGLSWSSKKVKKYKKRLLELNFIEIIYKRQGSKNKYYTKINFMQSSLSDEEIEKIRDNSIYKDKNDGVEKVSFQGVDLVQNEGVEKVPPNAYKEDLIINAYKKDLNTYKEDTINEKPKRKRIPKNFKRKDNIKQSPLRNKKFERYYKFTESFFNRLNKTNTPYFRNKKITEDYIQEHALALYKFKKHWNFSSEIRPALEWTLTTDNDFWKLNVLSFKTLKKIWKNDITKFANLVGEFNKKNNKSKKNNNRAYNTRYTVKPESDNKYSRAEEVI